MSSRLLQPLQSATGDSDHHLNPPKPLITPSFLSSASTTNTNAFTPSMHTIPNDISISNSHSTTSGQHKLHFTFDDGPNNITTPILLNYLEENEIYATFFLVGVNLDNPELIRLMQSKGHIVASQTFEHMRMTEKSDQQITESLIKVENIIKSATGKRPFLIRAPYGSIDTHIHEVLKQREYLHVRWDIDSMDWALKGREQQIIDNVDHAINRDRGGIV